VTAFLLSEANDADMGFILGWNEGYAIFARLSSFFYLSSYNCRTLFSSLSISLASSLDLGFI
jgi:hypothetical protein